MAELLFTGIVVLVALLLLRSHDTARGRAGKKLLLVGFAALVILAILFPEITTAIANVVGIGRGADLVFYLTSLAVMLLAALVYLKFKHMEARIADLTRAYALSEWERSRADGQEGPA